jgi:hypothetical protein
VVNGCAWSFNRGMFAATAALRCTACRRRLGHDSACGQGRWWGIDPGVHVSASSRWQRLDQSLARSRPNAAPHGVGRQQGPRHSESSEWRGPCCFSSVEASARDLLQKRASGWWGRQPLWAWGDGGADSRFTSRIEWILPDLGDCVDGPMVQSASVRRYPSMASRSVRRRHAPARGLARLMALPRRCGCTTIAAR